MVRRNDLEILPCDSIMILPTVYFGNIEYFYYLANQSEVFVDNSESFQKQTYRNRTEILSANGNQILSVPVVKPFGKKSKTFEIGLSDAEDWRKNHIKSIESAYRRTPFFEYYADDIFEIINRDFKTLIDLNGVLASHLIDKLGILCQIHYSNGNWDSNIDDKRRTFSPKIDSKFKTKRYIQTFEEKFGFQNNLSILDLLFNEGPNSICIIEESKFQT